MPTHRVDISAQTPRMKGTTRTGAAAPGATSGEPNDAGVIGIENKTPLSEPVLRQVGLFGGYDESGAVIDLRETEGAIFLPKPESQDACTTVAEVCAFLQEKYKGYFERTPLAATADQPERVSVRFTYGDDADIQTGSGPDTKSATRALATKLGETFACLGEG
jgi:hypothetical protein